MALSAIITVINIPSRLGTWFTGLQCLPHWHEDLRFDPKFKERERESERARKRELVMAMNTCNPGSRVEGRKEG